jgi:hypothetical protein
MRGQAAECECIWAVILHHCGWCSFFFAPRAEVIWSISTLLIPAPRISIMNLATRTIYTRISAVAESAAAAWGKGLMCCFFFFCVGVDEVYYICALCLRTCWASLAHCSCFSLSSTFSLLCVCAQIYILLLSNGTSIFKLSTINCIILRLNECFCYKILHWPHKSCWWLLTLRNQDYPKNKVKRNYLQINLNNTKLFNINLTCVS